VVSNSTYIVSMALLLALLAPTLRAASSSADASAAAHLSGGIAEQIDDLSPGMSTALSFDSSLGAVASVTLSGSTVTATVGGQSATRTVTWLLPTSVLSSGHEYVVSLDGAGVVELA
jgi:type II secretory pathway pseudopilin PulG